MDRLIERQMANIEKAYESIPMGGKLEFSKSAIEGIYQVLRELKEYKDLEEQGLLVRLPCKVGDYVYKIITQHSNYDDSPYKIVSTVCFRLDMLYEINKTVFLTREQAEEKLKEINK